jgi:hypothetical protein
MTPRYARGSTRDSLSPRERVGVRDSGYEARKKNGQRFRCPFRVPCFND